MCKCSKIRIRTEATTVTPGNRISRFGGKVHKPSPDSSKVQWSFESVDGPTRFLLQGPSRPPKSKTSGTSKTSRE